MATHLSTSTSMAAFQGHLTVQCRAVQPLSMQRMEVVPLRLNAGCG